MIVIHLALEIEIIIKQEILFIRMESSEEVKTRRS